MELIVESSGNLRCVYDEALNLGELGTPVITRASHVEPDTCGQWFADLAPVHGPRLGPFAERSQALVAEQRWLNEHWLIAPRH